MRALLTGGADATIADAEQRTALNLASLRGNDQSVKALIEAKELDTRRRAAGFDQAALDAAARAGFANGAFEDSPDERAAIAEEFYPETTPERTDAANSGGAETPPSLRDKLERKAVLLGGKAA